MTKRHPVVILSEQLHSLIAKSDKTSWQEALLPYYQKNDTPSKAYWLIGTDNCHLCDKMWELCQQAMMRTDVWVIQVELTDFDDKVATVLAPHIPVLIRKTDMVAYPFGLLEVL